MTSLEAIEEKILKVAIDILLSTSLKVHCKISNLLRKKIPSKAKLHKGTVLKPKSVQGVLMKNLWNGDILPCSFSTLVPLISVP